MPLPMYQRYEIAFLSCHPLGPKLGVKAVAKVMNCDKKTVKYWLNRFEQSKDLSDSRRCGRPRATTPKQDEKIVSLANEETFITSHDIHDKLKGKRVDINARTIRRRLHEAGAKFSRPLSKPLLTNKHRTNRLEWAQAQTATNWDHVIFTDETTVRLNHVKGFVWNLPGRKKVIRTVKHPVKVNVWGCFSSRGFGRIVCFPQNLNAKFMCAIYKRGLLATARKQFGLESTSWKLQEDNDPKHTSKLAGQWRTNNGVQKIDWPSMSPDLAPIENVWQLLKMKLRRRKLKTYRSLVAAIKREWKRLPSELATKLVASMENRLSEVVESQGDFIMR